MPAFKLIVPILCLLALSACATNRQNLASIAADVPKAAPAKTDIAASERGAAPPSGFAEFCVRLPGECARPTDAPSEITLTDVIWQRLELVNFAYNQAIAAQDDRTHYGSEEFWTIPTDGYGDCEDYVIAKRRALIALGVPEPALRITVVFTSRLVRHAVLTVATDRGNYVLDNLRNSILPQSQTGYAFVKRQDPLSASGWVALN